MANSFFLRILYTIFSVVIVNCSIYAQTSQPQKWKVVDVKNTFLEIGALKPMLTDFKHIKKQYMGKIFFFYNDRIVFPDDLKNSSSFCNNIRIGITYKVKKIPDTDQSFRYPGDELNCDSLQIVTGNCFVGSSFMHLLGSKSDSLTITNAFCDSNTPYVYKILELSKNRMAIFLMNSNLLLICSR